MNFSPAKTLLAAAALSAFTITAQAADTRIIIAPSCLVAASKIRAELLAWSDKTYLLKVDSSVIETLSDAKHQSKTPCGGFKDVTAKWQHAHHSLKITDDKSFLASLTKAKKPAAQQAYSIRFQKESNQLINQLNPQRMWSSLTTFSSSKDRYADSDEGVAAANWIKSEIETTAKNAGRDDVQVTLVDTDGHRQPSVVVMVGPKEYRTIPGTVIGAHLDTTSGRRERKPGADDDGSGSMTVLESARTIIESGVKFKKPIYFIWYSAEELGLLGSQQVVEFFGSEKIPVSAVMHFDMTGYAYRNEPTIWLMKDYVDSPLTNFTEEIIKTYTKKPVKYTRCGYACSDHASWYEQGYATVLPAESRFEDTNPVMHSSQDTMDKLSITHMTDYAKIATAFAVELAEPTS